MWLVMEELEPVQGVSQYFSSTHWLSLPCQGWCLFHSCLSRSPEGQLELALFPLSVFFFFLPQLGTFTPKEVSAEAVRPPVHRDVQYSAFVGICGSAYTQPTFLSFSLSWISSI